LKVDNLGISFFDGDEEIINLSKSYKENVLVLLKNEVPQNRWLIHSKEVKLPPEVKIALSHDTKVPTKLKESESVEISFAIALDEDGNTTFGYAAPGTTLKPFRFFFTMESRGGSYVKVDDAALKTIRIYVQGEGDTTGIVDAEFNTNAADQIFDLQGRRVTTPVKGGVYIVNGKKVYINK
jgi:hypothetical protein